MLLLQDEAAAKEVQSAKQQAQNKQARVRKVLEDQLSQIQQERLAASEAKKREAAELQRSIRQYEQEELQKWQQHKELQAKTKQMYSEQVPVLQSSQRMPTVCCLDNWCMGKVQVCQTTSHAIHHCYKA